MAEVKQIKYGKFSCHPSVLKGSFETVKKKFPHVREELLKGAYDQVKQDKEDKKKKD
jgi:hypothetical protein